MLVRFDEDAMTRARGFSSPKTSSLDGLNQKTGYADVRVARYFHRLDARFPLSETATMTVITIIIIISRVILYYYLRDITTMELCTSILCTEILKY